MLKNNSKNESLKSIYPTWLDACCIGVDFANPTIIDSTMKAGARYTGSFNIYNEKKHAVETVYIREVIYNKTCTIVFWSDNTKTISKCKKGDYYSEEVGLLYCIMKKLSKNSLDDMFDEWLPTEITLTDDPVRVSLKNLRKRNR